MTNPKHTDTIRSDDLKNRSEEVRSELWTALIGNDQSHKNLLARIEALEAENERLRGVLVDVAASLAAAISLLKRGGKAAKKAAPSDLMFDQMVRDYTGSLERARAALGEKQ